MRLDASGRLGLGTSSPGTLLEVVSSTDDDHLTLYKTGVVGGAGPGIKFSGQNNSGTRVHIAGIRNELTSGTVGAEGGALVFTTKDNGDASPQERLYISSAGNVGIGTTSPGSALEINAAAATSPFIAKINTAEAARIDSSGRLLIGTSSARGLFFAGGASALTQIEGNSTATASLSITRNDATADGNALILAKARSTAYAIVQYVDGTTSDDRIGRISFQGADGTNMVPAASIEAWVDATPGANDMPGRLVFSVTADGAASPTEALRISNDRSIKIGRAHV
jgi:hypothetical protein